MLEIGVARGGSLAAWSQYLGEQATVVGIDIDPACAAFDAPDVRRHVRIGRQEDIDFLQSIVKEFGPFDVVLDDGSHQSSHLNASFRYLFEHGLVPGGRYIAEDLHANYWTAWRDDPLSFVDLTKGMIDLMHAHYTTVPSEAAFRVDSDERVESCTVPRITKLLQRIDVYDSLIVIYKADSDRKLPSTLRTRAARSSAS